LGLWLVVLVSGVYFLGLVLVRWHMIAKPARAQIVAEIDAVRSRVQAEKASLPTSNGLDGRFEAISRLLDQALYAYKHKHFPRDLNQVGSTAPNETPKPFDTRVLWVSGILGAIFLALWLLGLFYLDCFGWAVYLLLVLWIVALIVLIAVVASRYTASTYYPWFTRMFNALFWTRGHELASWSLVHEAELQLVALLPLERVRARLETAEQELRDLNTPVASALADRIHESLTIEAVLIQDRSRELLQQLLPLLKPLSLPQVAAAVWFPDFQQRAQSCLQQILDWIQNNSTLATNPDDCKTRLQQFVQAANPCKDLAQEIGQVLPNVPDALKDVLQQIKDFLGQLAARIDQLNAVTQLDWNACAAALADIKTGAEKLIAALKAAPKQDQTLKGLLDSCKLQPTLTESVTRATIPSPSVALLQRILIPLQSQTEVVGKINAVIPGDDTDISPYRALLIQLASQPAPSSEFAEEIDCLLSTAPLLLLKRWRALLAEALSQVYENTDNWFFNIASWHNKMIWLIGSALLFIFALAVTLQNAILLLVGAVGGLLSRLQRAMASADVANDYGATWGALFLSPLTGALSAWGGILLIILGLKLNIFGTALTVDWCNPFDPVTLALALLFGFMERLFDGIAGTVQNKLLTSPSSSPSSGSTAAAPKIASISPTSAVLGKEVQLTVRGDNFQSGATATVTDDSGKQQPAKVEYKDAKTLTVTCTPSGSKAFMATVAITNPDKQTDTGKLSVTAGS
jgi:hypothetical protein